MKLSTLVLSLLILSQCIFAQTSRKKYNAFSGTTAITLEGGMNLAKTDYSQMQPDYLAKAHIELFFPTFTKSSFGIRLNGGTGFISGKDDLLTPTLFRTDMSFAGIGLIYALSIKESIFPYIAADVAYNWFNPKDEFGNPLPNNAAGKYKKSEINFGGELGFRFLLTENLSFNINAGVQVSPNDNLDDKIMKANNDLFYFSTIGLSFSFFSDRDSDSDGVPDSRDKCEDTPSGLKVDEFGCPVDSDGDGVPDYKDKCARTPKDVKVDEFGCPLDSDSDGVPDYSDLCPDTPIGVQVDDLGCPFDHDGDGVPDYMDKCPDTPHNIEIDRNGCPVDSDLDGIPDYKDQCPNTSIGTVVDSLGCPVFIEEKKPEVKEELNIPQLKLLTLNADKSFVKTNGELTTEGKAELNRLIFIMKSDPLSRWVIEGYTDSPAKAKKNDDIRRASVWTGNVLKYLIANNIPRNRFEVVNFGKSYPVADNKTEIGKSKNRRVLIKRVN